MKRILILPSLLTTTILMGNEPCETPPCLCFPPQYYDLQCDIGLYASVDFLYWFASECGISYAAQATTNGFSPTTTFPAITSLENVGTGFDPGFRIALGTNLCHDGWDVNLNWTYFRSKQKGSTSVSPFENIEILGVQSLANPWLLNPSLYPAFDSIKAKWDFRLNQIDLELGRRFWLSPCFNTRPYVALRGAWTDTSFKIHSSRTGGSFEDNIINANVDDNLHNSFWGGGICIGMQPTWYFCSCIGLYGTIDMALLWGKFNFKQEEETLQTLTATGATYRSFSVDATSHFSQMQAIFDLGLGLRYENTFCDRRYRVNFDLGWEFHAWFDQNQRFKILSSSNGIVSSFITTDHSVGFGGLVLRGRFDF